VKIFFTIKKKFNQLKINDDVWKSDLYKNHISKKYKKKINHNFFYSLLNILNKYNKKNKIITLDYGGGAGEYYYKHFFSEKKNIKIIILDNEKIISLGKKRNKFKNIEFINNLDQLIYKKINFLILSSVAQYIENIPLKIKKLIILKPDFIIFEDFHASNFKSFVTYQKFFNFKIPIKFHNINDLEKFLKKNNYNLVYKSAYLPLIKGKFRFYDMSNLPKKNRVKFTYNLLFMRK